LGRTDSEKTGKKVVAMSVKEEALRLTPRQREGRAINAVAELLRRTLSVPNIYLDPPASLIRADVLAVDRGGAGDLHAVEIKLRGDFSVPEGHHRKPVTPKELNERYNSWYSKYQQRLRSIHHEVMSLPAHFRYLAIHAENFDLAFGELAHFGLFPEDGIGRLGVITIDEKGGESPSAEIKIAPERFRVDPAKLRAIETKLLAKSRPDIEVRI
jgi:hypothetical protein